MTEDNQSLAVHAEQVGGLAQQGARQLQRERREEAEQEKRRETKERSRERIVWDDDGNVDEVVVADCHVHLERMDRQQWWLGITRGDMRLCLHIGKETGRLVVRVDENDLISIVAERRVAPGQQ